MKIRNSRAKGNKGYALLEYSAGAAVIATVLWAAMGTMGNGISGMLNNLGTWASNQAEVIDTDLNGGN